MIDVDLLRLETLIDLINEFKVGDLRLQNAGVLEEQQGQGQEFAWDILGIPRDIDSFEGKMSPAGVRPTQIIAQQTARLARTFKSTYVPGAVLMDLRNPGTLTRQRVAEDQVARELKALSDLIDRQNEFMIAGALQGAINMTIDGIAHTVDYGFSDTHKFEIGKAAALIGTDWSDPSADIWADIRRMVVAATQDSGYQPTTCWTSTEVIEALLKNDFVLSYFGRTNAGVEALTRGEIGELFGLRWIRYDYGFRVTNAIDDNSSPFTRYIPKNTVVMVPEPDQEWGFMRKGSDVVPTDDKRNIQEVIGRYAYSTISENPASIGLYAGEVRLPIIRRPDALCVAHVFA